MTAHHCWLDDVEMDAALTLVLDFVQSVARATLATPPECPTPTSASALG
ncbi:hypothetical protein JBE04_05665 [Streptomyces sp. PRKS01-29]|nr:hypothetical protein [Streptomyces sabulosicollis]MBI0293989.1 hypothetical protein [Streptomyces sabulosicollis]